MATTSCAYSIPSARAVVDALIDGADDRAFRAALTARHDADQLVSVLKDALPLLEAFSNRTNGLHDDVEVRFLARRARRILVRIEAGPVVIEADPVEPPPAENLTVEQVSASALS